jgi:hypothetical protein
MKLTGPRVEQQAYLLTLRRSRVLSADEYVAAKQRLERAEAGVQKRRVISQQKRIVRTAERKAIRQAQRQLRVISRNNIGTNDDLYRMWQQVRGRTVGIVLRNYESFQIMEVANTYTQFRRDFLVGYLNEDYDVDIEDISKLQNGELIFIEPTQLTANRVIQAFRDGITHCVFTPIKQHLTQQLENANTTNMRKRLRQRLNAIDTLEKTYANGVPESKMEEVAKTIGCKIRLTNVIGNDMRVYNEHGRNGTLIFKNTRLNHVENIVSDHDPIEVDEATMTELWTAARASGWYMIDGDIRNQRPSALSTLTGSYRIADPLRDACKKFDEELNIGQYRLNATKYPEVNSFLKEGRIINGWSCTISDGIPTGCADMPAAYSQFEQCKYYRGFMGHIHQWRSGDFDRTFMEQHIGYYRVVPTSAVSDLFERVGLKTNEPIILFVAEILYFMDNGIQFTCDAGVWGSRFDFSFPEYMMENRAYCIWSGRLGMERTDRSYTFPGDKEMASHLAADHKVFHWADDNLITLKQRANSIYTAHHILGAITSYVRIQMLETMKQFNINNIVRVVMDGIYYNNDKPSGLDWFKDKPVKAHDGHSMTWYNQVATYDFPMLKSLVNNTLLTGQGGSGKTYSIFNDAGYNSPLFVSPSHILGQDVKDKYGANYTTINKLIGIDCQPYKAERGEPAVVLIDEITQVDAAWVDKVFQLYPRTLIILAGDIDAEGRWYQCRTGDGDSWNNIWKPHGVDIFEKTKDRRSRDQDLADLKLKIRDQMREVCFDADANMLMKMWAHQNLQFTETLDIQPEDTVIAATHKINQLCLDNGFITGYYKKGGYISKTPQEGYEPRGSFTIHSFQGKTVDTGRVWIFVDDIFEYAMLYTAVSRAVNFDQLRFVRRPLD